MIVVSLKEKLKQGDTALVGNNDYCKYLKRATDRAAFIIDEEKLKAEECFDGKCVLRTNTSYSAEQVVFQYK